MGAARAYPVAQAAAFGANAAEQFVRVGVSELLPLPARCVRQSRWSSRAAS